NAATAPSNGRRRTARADAALGSLARNLARYAARRRHAVARVARVHGRQDGRALAQRHGAFSLLTLPSRASSNQPARGSTGRFGEPAGPEVREEVTENPFVEVVLRLRIAEPREDAHDCQRKQAAGQTHYRSFQIYPSAPRSEEHTSELQ